ncbi:MAG TPA: hypothetical protein DCX21_04640 [Eubacterium sp.]|nr:hypothetical protein [Eubacterium sp.]
MKKKQVYYAGALLCTSLFLSSCNNDKKESDSTKENTKVEATQADTDKKEDKSKKEDTSNKDTSEPAGNTDSKSVVTGIKTEKNKKLEFSVENVRKSTDNSGKPVLLFDITYKNLTDSTQSIDLDIEALVFQNGKQLGIAFDSPEYNWAEEFEAISDGVKAGKSLTAHYGYNLVDDSVATLVIVDNLEYTTYLVQDLTEGSAPKSEITASGKKLDIKASGTINDYGTDYFYIDADFTNNTDTPVAFCNLFTARAYQDGIECYESYLTSDVLPEDGSYTTAIDHILPGYTYTARIFFKKNSDSDPKIVITDTSDDNFGEVVSDSTHEIFGKEGTKAEELKTDLTFEKSEIIEHEGSKVLLAYFTFSNGEKEPQSVSFLTSEDVGRQGDVQLNTPYIFDLPFDLRDTFRYVLPGYKFTVVYAYTLNDTTTPVSITLTYTDGLEKTFDINLN